MQRVQETDLAWRLIESVEPELDARERNHVFVSVGAGDSFTAIRILLKLIAVKQIPLPSPLVQLCSGWLEAYALHEDHERLQVIIDGLAVTPEDLRVWVTAGSRACRRYSPTLSIVRTVYRRRGATAPAG